jgi:hypothetical protein
MQNVIERSSLQLKLEEACIGLFPAGNFRQCNGFHYENPLGKRPSLESILTWAGYPENTPAEVLNLKHFLSPFTSQLPEYGLAEKSRARKFLKLQNTLEDMLDYVKVYCLGEKGDEAIIVGETTAGTWAGLRAI